MTNVEKRKPPFLFTIIGRGAMIIIMFSMLVFAFATSSELLGLYHNIVKFIPIENEKGYCLYENVVKTCGAIVYSVASCYENEDGSFINQKVLYRSSDAYIVDIFMKNNKLHVLLDEHSPYQESNDILEFVYE